MFYDARHDFYVTEAGKFVEKSLGNFWVLKIILFNFLHTFSKFFNF